MKSRSSASIISDADYLQRPTVPFFYREETMKKTLTLLLSLGTILSLQTAIAQDAEALFNSKPCAVCHALDTQKVGPALKAVAAKYAGQDDAKTVLVNSITHGSQGKWGAMPMPPNAVTAEEAETLADWILSQQ